MSASASTSANARGRAREQPRPAPKRQQISLELREPTFEEFAGHVRALMASAGKTFTSDTPNADIVDVCSRVDTWSDITENFAKKAFLGMGFEKIKEEDERVFMTYKNKARTETEYTSVASKNLTYCKLPNVLSDDNLAKEYFLVVRDVSGNKKSGKTLYKIPAKLKRLPRYTDAPTLDNHLRKLVFECTGHEQFKTESDKYEKIDVDSIKQEIKDEYENENFTNFEKDKSFALKNPVLLTMFDVEFKSNDAMCAAYAALMIRGYTWKFNDKQTPSDYVWLCEKLPADGTNVTKYHPMDRRALIRMHTTDRALYTMFDTPIPITLSTRAGVAAWATNLAVMTVGKNTGNENSKDTKDTRVRYLGRMRYAAFQVLLKTYNMLNDSAELGTILTGMEGISVSDNINESVSAAEYICFNLRAGTAMMETFKNGPNYKPDNNKPVSTYNGLMIRGRLGIFCKYFLGYAVMTIKRTLNVVLSLENNNDRSRIDMKNLSRGTSKGTYIPYLSAVLSNGPERMRVTIGYVKNDSLGMNDTRKEQVVNQYVGVLNRLQAYKNRRFSELVHMLFVQNTFGDVNHTQDNVNNYVEKYLDEHASTTTETTNVQSSNDPATPIPVTPHTPFPYFELDEDDYAGPDSISTPQWDTVDTHQGALLNVPSMLEKGGNDWVSLPSASQQTVASDASGSSETSVDVDLWLEDHPDYTKMQPPLPPELNATKVDAMVNNAAAAAASSTATPYTPTMLEDDHFDIGSSDDESNPFGYMAKLR